MKCVSTCVNHSLVARSVKAATARGLRFFCEGDPKNIVPKWFYLIVLLWTEESCTTLDGSNPMKNGINHLWTGGGFLPSTVNHVCICLHQLHSIARFKIRQFQNGSLEFGLHGWYSFFLAKDTKRAGWHCVVIASHPNFWPAHQSDQRWNSPWFMNPQSAFDSRLMLTLCTFKFKWLVLYLSYWVLSIFLHLVTYDVLLCPLLSLKSIFIPNHFSRS